MSQFYLKSKPTIFLNQFSNMCCPFIGMRKFTSQEAEDLRDVIEQRSYGKSTIITSQLPFDHWSEIIGDQIILDALIDRLEAPGITIKLKGESYRQKTKKEVAKKGPQE